MSAAERFLAGRVRVRASGARAESVINAAFGREVRLGNVLRESSRQIAFDVDYGDFFAMRAALRDAGCKIRILRREGVPHIRARLRLRFMLAVGAVMCALAVMGLTQFVWGVSIIGEMDIEQRAVAQEILDAMDIRAGTLRGEVDFDAVEGALMEGIGDLTFVGVRMRGLTLQVQIVPSPEAPRMLGVGIPADIVADIAGTVERVMVLEGTAAVSPGQEVRPGDVLIRGVAVGPGGQTPVHAMGEVTVRVWVSGEGTAPLYSRETKATGRYINRRTVLLGGVALPEHPYVPFSEYIIASRETMILPNLYIPASVLKETLHEVQMRDIPRKEGEVRREAEQNALLDALGKLREDTTIVDKRVEFSKMKDTTLHAAVRLQTLESIGVERAR